MSLTLIFFCALRDSNPRPIAWRMAFLPTHLSSTCDSVKNNFILNYHVEGPFVRIGNTNRDKRPLSPPLARLAVGPGTKATFCPESKGSRDKWPGTNVCSVVVVCIAF